MSDKYVALSNLSIYCTCKNIKKYNKIQFRISTSTWNDTFELFNGSYSVSDIQDFFEYVIKKHESATGNPPIRTYVNKLENRVIFEN